MTSIESPQVNDMRALLTTVTISSIIFSPISDYIDKFGWTNYYYIIPLGVVATLLNSANLSDLIGLSSESNIIACLTYYGAVSI